MVVCDFLKNQFNKGLDNNLFFFRDKSQHEVDLILEDGIQLYAYEIKIASTIRTEFYKNLNYFRALFPDETASTQVINTGGDDNPDPTFGHINYKRLP